MKRIVVTWTDPQTCGSNLTFRYYARLSSTTTDETANLRAALRTASSIDATYADTDYGSSLDTLKVTCERGIANPTLEHTVGTITIDLGTAGNYPPGTDATLSALTVSPTDIIGFDSDTTSYHVGRRQLRHPRDHHPHCHRPQRQHLDPNQFQRPAARAVQSASMKG